MKELNRYDLSLLDFATGTGLEIYMHDPDHLEREVSRIDRSLNDMRQQLGPLGTSANSGMSLDSIKAANLSCPENIGLETEADKKLSARSDLIDMSLVLETDHFYIERNDFVLEFKDGGILRFKAPGFVLNMAEQQQQQQDDHVGNSSVNNNANLFQMQPTTDVLEWLKAISNMYLTSIQLDLPEWIISKF